MASYSLYITIGNVYDGIYETMTIKKGENLLLNLNIFTVFFAIYRFF